MTSDLERRIDDYLDGALSREEARTMERDLARDPETAKALTIALALREALLDGPPPPEGLEEEIMRALSVEVRAQSKQQKKEEGRVTSAQVLLAGVGAGLRAPGLLLRGTVDAGEQPAAKGLAQARWILGPLGAPKPHPQAPPKPLWRRALDYAWRKL